MNREIICQCKIWSLAFLVQLLTQAELKHWSIPELGQDTHRKIFCQQKVLEIYCRGSNTRAAVHWLYAHVFLLLLINFSWPKFFLIWLLLLYFVAYLSCGMPILSSYFPLFSIPLGCWGIGEVGCKKLKGVRKACGWMRRGREGGSVEQGSGWSMGGMRFEVWSMRCRNKIWSQRARSAGNGKGGGTRWVGSSGKWILWGAVGNGSAANGERADACTAV